MTPPGPSSIDFALETGAITEQVTVTAETPLLQSDVTIRKVVDSKDIEQLSFSGRNPIGVASLKPGVVGGSFNTRGFADLGNGGFNINGSRSDENNITVDGATAIRTRSTGAIIGIQNVDAIQEVQVLTANYMPEFGRSSGGQIRFVTKSGSNRFSGSASFFYQDDSLNANSWSRNRSTNPVENSGPAPFDQKQYGYSFGGPIPLGMFKDKLFFFGAQEWVNFYRDQTAIITVPTAAMRNGDFSELLNPANGFFSGARVINDPTTGQPFPSNVIPVDRLSPNGRALLNAYPMPTPGFRQGTNNAIITSPNPQDQRKDNIRFDYRFNERNNISYRFGRYNWVAVDAFRGDLPFARTDWERPNYTNTASWTSTFTSNLINELSYTYSRDDVFINVFQEGDLYKRSNKGINYPYIFQEKEIFDKIPTVSFGSGGFREMDGGPYPASSSGPITTVSEHDDLGQGPSHVEGRYPGRVLGRGRLRPDQRQRHPGQHEQPERPVRVPRRPGGRHRRGDRQRGPRALQQLRRAGAAQLHQVAFAGHRRVRAGLVEADEPADHRRRSPLGAVAAVVLDDQQHRELRSELLRSGPGGDHQPGDRPAGRSDGPLQRHRPAGRRIRGRRRRGPDRPAHSMGSSSGAPRGFSETHYNVFEPRLGVSYQLNEKTIVRASGGIFHNRVTLNDSTLLGGNPPFQPQATVSNGSVDNPGGGGTAGAATLPFGINGQDPVFKHPTSYMWGIGIQREIPLGFTMDITYIGRRGNYLQRERNINQLQAGTLQANPGVNIAALRPFKGYNVIRVSENSGSSKYNSLQISADRRYRNGLKVGFAYTLGKSEDNASNKRTVLWNTYDDTNMWGASDFDRRHVASVYYIYELPFMRDQSTLMRNLLGGWQVSGATFFRTGTPFAVLRNDDAAGVGDGGFLQPANVVGDVNAGANKQFSTAVGDGNFWFNPAAFAKPAAGTFGNSPRNNIYNPGEQQWDIALFKNFMLGGTRRAQFRAEFFNFPNHPNWSNAQTDSLQGQGWANPSNANFGRVVSKQGERTAQLSLRFLF